MSPSLPPRDHEVLHLLLVGGSTRVGSTNTMALAALHALDEPQLATDLYDGLRGLPAFVAYDEPPPAAVAELLERISAADAVVFAVPEYAGGLPGAVKNLLDWTVGGGQLYGKPVAWLDVASPGRGGGARGQLRTVLGYVGARIVEPACIHLDVTRRDGEPRLEAGHPTLLRTAVSALRAAVAVGSPTVPPAMSTTQQRDWPPHLAPHAVRWARTSRHYELTVRFYRDLVGLPVLEQFTGSFGEDGTLFGLPDTPVHLEITRAHDDAPDSPAPARPGDELVFYLPGPVAVADATRRLREAGAAPDEAPPPYWAANRAVVFRDPDGFGVVYAAWVYARDPEPAEHADG